MGKLARAAGRSGPTGPVTTTRERILTAEGGPGWARDVKSELFLLAITNMVGEQTFYEDAGDRDDRFTALVHQAVAEDAAWVARLIPWLRTGANMRTASVVAAAEYARALQAMDHNGAVYRDAVGHDATRIRTVVSSALQRPDEPGEFCAYWFAGRRPKHNSLPAGVQRGVEDAAVRLFSEKAALKYDGVGQLWRLGDVLVVTKAASPHPWQQDLFDYLVDRRYGRDEIRVTGRLPMIRARLALDEIGQDERRVFLAETGAAGRLAEAGMTWEALSGWLGGPMDRVAWESIIPSMGLMATIRNLRNFDEAGVSDQFAAAIAARLADAEQVRRSRMFPLRFLSAYKTAPSDRWRWPLEQAVQHSLSNVPRLPGRTLVLIDCSGSMQAHQSNRSELMRCEAAALFGLALAKRAEYADVVRYGTGHQPVKLTGGANLLREVAAVGCPDMGGTNTFGTLAATYRAGFHDRVVILTDEQAHGGGVFYGGYYASPAPEQVLGGIGKPVVTFNLAGHKAAHMESGPGRLTVGGLTDAGFAMLGALDARHRGEWPF